MNFMEELDINRVTSDLILHAAEKLSSKIISKGHDFIKDKCAELFKTAFVKYKKSLNKNIIKTKTFFSPDNPIDLKTFYVSSDIKTPFKEKRVIKSCKIQDICKLSRFSIIEASGGAGKTMLMKYFTSNALESQFAIPIFIELRKLTKIHDDFEINIIEFLRNYDIKITDDLIKKYIDNGTFVFILDGFDEIPIEISQSFIDSLTAFTLKNDNATIVLSSRYDDSLSGLKNFTKYQVMPFNLEKSIEVIDKLPEDESLKKKFIDDLKKTLFERHRSFLSNPLLLSIMLLTYGRTGSIPEKISTFYSQAYEALYSRHDRLKDCFQRKKRSGLDILDFERVFSAFSLLSYLKGKHYFNKVELNEYINKSKKITGIEFKNDDLIYDMTSSVCLLIVDGIYYSFSHRSFQEYFAAKQLQKLDTGNKLKIIRNFSNRNFHDQILRILFEIDKEFVEKHLITNYINELKIKIGFRKSITFNIYKKFLINSFSEIGHYHDDKIFVAIKENDNRTFFAFIFIFIYHNYIAPKLPKHKEKSLCDIERKRIYFDKPISKEDLAMLKKIYYSDCWVSKMVIEKVFLLLGELESKYQNITNDIDKLLGCK